MSSRPDKLRGGVLAELTLPELVDVWVESEIDRRMQEIERFHSAIIDGAFSTRRMIVMPLRGGIHERPRSVEVLVEVRDPRQRRSRIGAWTENKRAGKEAEAFRLAYDKAMAHAIIQLLPASIWRPWIGASSAV